jgi:predicted nucleic-acid-binding Zn-ribbon protein
VRFLPKPSRDRFRLAPPFRPGEEQRRPRGAILERVRSSLSPVSSYGGLVALAVAFGVWEKLRPERSSNTSLPSERSSRGTLYPTSEAEQQARRVISDRYLPLLDELWVVPEYCPVCRSEGFHLGSPSEARLVMQSPAFEPRQQAYVYLPARCDTCGYTVFFDADLLEARIREREKSSKG